MARELSKYIEKGRSLVRLSGKGFRLAEKIPEPVQRGIGHLRRRSLIIALEVFAGLIVTGGVLLALMYGSLNQGPISLTFLVPTIEESINRELTGVTVKIDDFIVQHSEGESGMSFRLRNVRLIDNAGAIVAQAPSAAVGLSGRALLYGRIAPGSVDFIGPRLLLFYTPETGLSLTFSRGVSEPKTAKDAQSPAGPAPADPQSAATEPLEPGIALIAPSRKINLTRTITSAFESARRRETATSYLTRFGVRDAIVIFDQGGKASVWQVPDFSIDLEHRQKRSIILGEASISSATGPWKLKFRTEQSQKQQRLTFTALIQDLIPTGLAANFPDIPALQAFNLPLDAETSIHLSTSGELIGAEAKLRLSAGHVVTPWERKYPMLIDEGDLHVRYQAKDDRVEILPSTLQWGESRATISGEFTPKITDNQIKSWSFQLVGNDSVLAVEEFGLAPSKVDQWNAEGTFYPEGRRIDLTRLVMRIGDAAVALAGSVVDAPGSPAVNITGRISPMPISTLKLMWPKFITAGAREWVGENVTRGYLTGGSLAINMPGGMMARYIDNSGEIPDSAMQLDAEARDLEIHYIDGLPPLQMGKASLRIDGRRFAFTAPKGSVALPSGKRVEFEQGRFDIADMRPDPQRGVVKFHMKSDAQPVLELLDHKPLEYVKAIGLKPGDLGGRTSGDFSVQLPLIRNLDYADIKLRGTAELQEASVSKAFGKISVEGGAVTLNVTEKALDARGDILLNGVPALLSWQRIFGAAPDKQPDLRLTTLLDQNARTQLGIDVNHMVRGPVSAILSLRQGSDVNTKYRVRADLGNADIIMSNMGWRKPPGRPAILTFDIGTGIDGNSELQNFKLDGGQLLGIEGWVALGKDDKPRAFYFPEFTFNVITRMEIAGEKRADNIWDVQAHGSAYDGRQFFRSLFSAGQLVENQATPPADLTGLDLTAKIGAVAGYSDTALSDVSISLQKRGGLLTSLDVTGMLNGTAPTAVKLTSSPGQPRIVLAESDDAGAAFKLVGFYPRIEGGKASLQVNLDASGPGAKAGILWAKDFDVIGDRVVSEVIANASDDPTVIFGERQTQPGVTRRKRIPFDQLKVPFSVGNGRFELHDTFINGPQLGATVRGHVDFTTQQIDIGGTYIPVYGLNSALGSIPIIGNLLVGRRGEGIVGITFAVKGPMHDPNVLVNPMSMVAPGIFRQIFEYTGPSPDSFPDPKKEKRKKRRQRKQSSVDEPVIPQN